MPSFSHDDIVLKIISSICSVATEFEISIDIKLPWDIYYIIFIMTQNTVFVNPDIYLFIFFLNIFYIYIFL